MKPESHFMRVALNLARRGYGATSPNPMVGAVIVRNGRVIGRGWHRRAGLPHAEIEAIHHARGQGHSTRGATLFVTLEPCCTHGRTPPCTEAIIAAGIQRVVIGATDPNPKHAGRAFRILRRAGIAVNAVLASECEQLNEVFNHWIVRRTPFVTVKAAMTLDGKIATATGESRWITGEEARAASMELRRAADAILVGVNTIEADDPNLTFRGLDSRRKVLRRIVLDSHARTPRTARILNDEFASATTIVVCSGAPKIKVTALSRRVNVLVQPRMSSKTLNRKSEIDLRWLLQRLGSEDVTHLLVEGGGEVNASFLLGGYAQRVVFFYAPKIIGSGRAIKAVGGLGIGKLGDALPLRDTEWKRFGPDLRLSARVG